MRGVVCAVAVGVINGPSSEGRTFIVDPSEAELPSLSASGCFAFMYSSTLSPPDSKSNDDIPVSSLIWTNFASSLGVPFNEADLGLATAAASEAASQIWIKMKQSIATIEKRTVSHPVPHRTKQVPIKNESEDASTNGSEDDE